MTTLRSGEITRLQAITDDHLPNTATVYRPSYSADGSGGQKDSLTEIASPDVRVSAVGRNIDITAFASKIGDRQPFVLTFGSSADVAEEDQAVVGDYTYKLIGKLSGPSWDLAQTFLAVRL